MNKQLHKALKAALKGEAKLDVSKTAFWSTYIAPLQNAHGVIDWKAGPAKTLKTDVYATVAAWFCDVPHDAPRVIGGVTYDKAALKVAISKAGTSHKARDGALSAIRVKVWRWTEGLHAAELKRLAQESGETSSKAPSGKVATGKAATLSQKRSAAAKGNGKAAPQATPTDTASVPQLTDQLRAALLKAAPQARIVHATTISNMMWTIVKEARHAIDTAPRKAAKGKAAKGKAAQTATAPAPAAIQ